MLFGLKEVAQIVQVSSSKDGTIKVWEIDLQQELLTLPWDQGTVDQIAFSPNGKTVASTGGQRILKLWNAATDQEVRAQSK